MLPSVCFQFAWVTRSADDAAVTITVREYLDNVYIDVADDGRVRGVLPSGMPSRPTYRKANPSDAPIMILTLTSDTWSQGELYDFASTQLAQTIAQIDGVGDVDEVSARLDEVLGL